MSNERMIILNSLQNRPDMASINKQFLGDIVDDAILDVKDMIHYSEDEELPEGLYSIVKKLVCAEIARVGYVGVSNYSFSGVSTSFSSALDDKDKRKIRHYRRFPNGDD